VSGKVDWLGNITFGLGLTVMLAGITYGIQPYGDDNTGRPDLKSAQNASNEPS